MAVHRNAVTLLTAWLTGLSLAYVCGAHALSSASTRLSPELALLVFPLNGLAAEVIAYSTFVDEVKESRMGSAPSTPTVADGQEKLIGEFRGGTTDLQPFAVDVIQPTHEALMLEPLLPRAHALLAMAETDSSKKKQILALASRLNRRDIALQALALQDRADDGDYAGSIRTLDQILRVHPERQADFFPLLVDALAQKETRRAFSDLLRNDLPWRDSFLGFAVGNPRALKNLAAIRRGINLDNPAFDQRLIAGLVALGEVTDAAGVYEVAVGPSLGVEASWQSIYPPFDWKLSDVSGLRARAHKSLDKLDFSIEPGNGGILASKLIPSPPSPFKIRVSVSQSPIEQTERLKIQISCWSQATPFFEAALENGTSVVEIIQNPGCPYLQVSIAGRAWTGLTALEGTLGPLEIILPKSLP